MFKTSFEQIFDSEWKHHFKIAKQKKIKSIFELCINCFRSGGDLVSSETGANKVQRLKSHLNPQMQTCDANSSLVETI